MSRFIKGNDTLNFITSVTKSNNMILKNASNGYYLPNVSPGQEIKLIEKNHQVIIDAASDQMKKNTDEAAIAIQKNSDFLNSFSHQLEHGAIQIKDFLFQGVDKVSDVLGLSGITKYLMLFAGALLLVLLIRR